MPEGVLHRWTPRNFPNRLKPICSNTAIVSMLAWNVLCDLASNRNAATQTLAVMAFARQSNLLD